MKWHSSKDDTVGESYGVTTRLHKSIAHPTVQEAYFVFHHPITLHPTDYVFDTDSDGRYHTPLWPF